MRVRSDVYRDGGRISVAELTAAVSSVTGALLEEWDRHVERADLPSGPIPYGSQPLTTRDQGFVAGVAEEPRYWALRLAARRLGEIAHEHGGRPTMDAVCDAMFDLPRGDRRASILNSLWDGIGSWAA